MIEYKTDEEKAEDIKAWWREYGSAVIGAIVLSIAGLFGWEYWQKWQTEKMESAAQEYHLMEQNSANDAQVTQSALELQQNYKSTPYAALASMQHAKLLAEKGEYDGAATALRWVTDHTKDEDLKSVASLRLARVLVSAGKLDEAAPLAEKSYGKAYESLQEELKGDIAAARNDKEAARKAYERAILTNQNGSNELIQLKLDNLGQGA